MSYSLYTFWTCFFLSTPNHHPLSFMHQLKVQYLFYRYFCWAPTYPLCSFPIILFIIAVNHHTILLIHISCIYFIKYLLRTYYALPRVVFCGNSTTHFISFLHQIVVFLRIGIELYVAFCSQSIVYSAWNLVYICWQNQWVNKSGIECKYYKMQKRKFLYRLKYFWTKSLAIWDYNLVLKARDRK